MMFIEAIQEIDNLTFGQQKDLKKPKYKQLTLWDEGWETIMLGAYPKGQKVLDELKEIQRLVKSATDEQKQQYINCDEDGAYYIKQYMDDHDLEYSQDTIDFSRKQCSPVIKHHKNHFNRARPYQVAEHLGMEFERFETETSKTPSYPSGHTTQPLVSALYYSKMYPQHQQGIMNGAKISGFGRVIAGLHYPSDYEAGVKLGKELFKYMKVEDIKEDAPMNSTGGAISMPPTMQKKKTDKRYDTDNMYKLLRRYI